MPTLGFLKNLKRKDKPSLHARTGSSATAAAQDRNQSEPPTPLTATTSTSTAHSFGQQSSTNTTSTSATAAAAAADARTEPENTTPTPLHANPPPSSIYSSSPSVVQANSPTVQQDPMALVSERPMIPEHQQQQSQQFQAPSSPSVQQQQQQQQQQQPHQSNVNSLLNPPEPAQYDGTPSHGHPSMISPGVSGTQTGPILEKGGQAQQQQGQSQQQQTQQQQVRSTKGKYALSDFNIQRTLGTGSFGRVHLVQSRHNMRFYAIKVLKKAQVVKMKQVEHTNDERRMLQKVKHPFLITLWGTFQDNRNLYMVMDFIEGGELFSLLRKSQRFPNPVAKFYAAEVALALEYLHEHHIIYRDLKPENLLLDRHGHLKITDFGFAKEVPDITWTLCGTPDYLAPEVVSSKGYNKSVDWWSLGILIFEMLCGYTPFWDGGSPMKIYENILKGKVKYPAYIHPDAQDLLQQLITPDLTKRLGNLVRGSEDIKRHQWFAEVNWERLLRKDIEAPYVPPVRSGVGDASQFDRYPEDTEDYYKNDGIDQYGHLFEEF